jgi:glutamate formiminotransferase/formiminotetrahydrofolate cyclodeaminase
VDVKKSEIVGLIPERAIVGAANAALQLPDAADHILEAKIREAQGEGGGPTLDGWIDELAGGSPTPGGGSAAALAGALAASLVAMVARLTIGKKAYAAVESRAREILAEAESLRADLRRLVDEDAAAYENVSRAYKIPKDAPDRARAIDDALIAACRTPADVARRAARTFELAKEIASIGNKNAVSDARVGQLLASAAVEGAVENVRVNAAALSDKTTGAALLAEAARLAVG